MCGAVFCGFVLPAGAVPALVVADEPRSDPQSAAPKRSMSRFQQKATAMHADGKGREVLLDLLRTSGARCRRTRRTVSSAASARRSSLASAFSASSTGYTRARKHRCPLTPTPPGRTRWRSNGYGRVDRKRVTAFPVTSQPRAWFGRPTAGRAAPSREDCSSQAPRYRGRAA